MTLDEIQQRARRHNLLQALLGCLLLAVSLVMWLLSFWILRWCLSWSGELLKFFGMTSVSPGTLGTVLAAIGIIALILEGVRYGLPALSGHDVADSQSFNSFLESRGDRSILSLNVWSAQLGVSTMLFSHILCIAPHTTIDGLLALRSQVKTDSETASEALRILTQLKEHRKWVLADNYRESVAALMLLENLRLIWVERRDDVEIRYPAGE